MTDHPEYRALLRAVLDAPADDVPRLVLADWWDEHGEPGRAEFVHVQVELAALGSKEGGRHGEDGHRECPGCCRVRFLRRRERALLDPHWSEWSKPVRAGYCLNLYTKTPLSPPNTAITFRRGFVESLACNLAAFLAHAPAVFAGQPVTGVVLTDRGPVQFGNRGTRGPGDFGGEDTHFWITSADPETLRGENRLPAALRPYLGGHVRDCGPAPRYDAIGHYFPTREAALSALSLAAARYGRANAAGWTHEGPCPHCGGGRGGTWCYTVNNNSRCETCDGKRVVTRPGLAPL